MIPNINLTIPSFIEDLTKVNFGKANESLNFRFVKAYETTIDEIITSRNIIPRHLSSPDAIRFIPNEKLVKKICELDKNINFLRIPKSYHPEAGSYEIHAIHSNIFFKAIRQLQASDPEINIPLNLFKEALSNLQKHDYLTTSQILKHQRHIKTSLTLNEYIDDLQDSRDFKKALALAYYYINEVNFNEKAVLSCLCSAQRYLGEESLGALIDLNGFLIKFTSINSLIIFKTYARAITDTIAQCATIKKLEISAYTDYDLITTQEIGRFLSNANFIEKASFPASPFTKHHYEKLNEKTIIPIAEALRTNSSLKKLNLSGTIIGDIGVLKVIEALEVNIDSKMTELNFFNCGMTNKSAVKVLELFEKMEQLTWVNVKWNRQISSSIQEKFDQIIEKRNPQLTQF
ncbi:MAG: hypothetical protein Q8K60_00030 [Parachlamydiaceae bacterium]|nr:hypothetical protein [Parachlamydiaceae bacterium]